MNFNSTRITGILYLCLSLTVLGACKDKPTAAPTQGKTLEVELTLFEKQILLNVDAIEKDPSAQAFFQEIERKNGLRAAMNTGLKGEKRTQFKEIVAKYQPDPDFQRAVQDPHMTAPEDCADPAAQPKKPLLSKPKPAPDPLMGTEPGCADSSASVENNDVLFP